MEAERDVAFRWVHLWPHIAFRREPLELRVRWLASSDDVVGEEVVQVGEKHPSLYSDRDVRQQSLERKTGG